jgi:predicted transcriptional regulator
MTREKALETINELPLKFDIEDLIERLIFIEKIEKGLQQLDEGKTKSHFEVKKIIQSWQK